MNEIKSTLDIIMEKAKAFEVTEEEKETFQREDLERLIRGFLQKYLDGILGLEKLKEEVIGLGEGYQHRATWAVLEICMEQIDPIGDNEAILDVLKEVGQVEVGPLMELLQEFREAYNLQEARQEKEFRKRLKGRGISGSAVIVNIQGDPGWQEEVTALKKGFRDKMDTLYQQAWLDKV
jgi:hypothetical protein